MRKIFGLTVAALLVMGLVGGGTWAFFNDPETVTDNVFTAGTLDLKTDLADGVSGKFTASNAKPGDTLGTGTIALSNDGTLNASSLDIAISYVEDGSEPSEPTDTDLDTELDADGFAELVHVTALEYGGTDLLSGYTENATDSNAFIDLKELAYADLTGQAGLNTGESKDFDVTMVLHTSAGNDAMADGVDVTFTFTLNQ